jgi:hypothetical protein
MPQANEDYVLDLLRDVGLVTRKQIEEARADLNGSTSVVDVLVRQGIVSADDISRSLAAQAHMHWIDLSDIVVPQEVIDEIKPQDARRFKMIPIARNEHGLVVATGDPLDFDSIDSLSFLLRREIELVCTTPRRFGSRSSNITAVPRKRLMFCGKKSAMPRSKNWILPRAPKYPKARGRCADRPHGIIAPPRSAQAGRERHPSRAARKKFPGSFPD